ncbi:MAG: hypothetical protein AAF823_15860 [Planctomycetota bacterium]
MQLDQTLRFPGTTANLSSAERIARGLEGLTTGMQLLDAGLDRTHDMLHQCRNTFKTDTTHPAA